MGFTRLLRRQARDNIIESGVRMMTFQSRKLDRARYRCRLFFAA